MYIACLTVSLCLRYGPDTRLYVVDRGRLVLFQEYYYKYINYDLIVMFRLCFYVNLIQYCTIYTNQINVR